MLVSCFGNAFGAGASPQAGITAHQHGITAKMPRVETERVETEPSTSQSKTPHAVTKPENETTHKDLQHPAQYKIYQLTQACSPPRLAESCSEPPRVWAARPPSGH